MKGFMKNKKGGTLPLPYSRRVPVRSTPGVGKSPPFTDTSAAVGAKNKIAREKIYRANR